MHELVVIDGNSYVRRARCRGREEQQVTRRDVRAPDGLPDPELIPRLARKVKGMLCEDVLSKPAAIEPVGGASAIAVGCALQLKGSLEQ